MELSPEQRLEGLARDTTSGATEISRRAAELLRDVITRSVALTLDDFVKDLTQWGSKIIQSQPSMTPLFHLVRSVTRAIQSGVSIEAAQKNALRALDDFVSHLRESPGQIASHFVAAIPQAATILTHSFSETVLTALLRAQASGRSLSVIATESRPQLEGRTLAAHLHRTGIPTTLIVDAAAARWIPTADLVLVGADTVCESGVVNKIGTRMIALAAQEMGVSVVVLADSSKFRPSNLPALDLNHERPPAEVWADAPVGLRVWNQYFELTPLCLVTTVITESGGMTPTEVIENLHRYGE
ncbi:MAG TPA: translation initiation factor eIF-2B [Blastocatellia bacterium]|nr:translation initiation factor eIF-2B [Blastocatellia bacterium]